MATLLLSNARVVVTMDGSEIDHGSILVKDGWIEEVGPADDMVDTADQVVSLTDHVVLPGLVNTHHHLYQTLTRSVPAAQDAGLFDWLRALYPVWARMTPDHVRTATTIGLAELALSGCTTAFDHHYLWPGGARVDDQVEGAAPVGVRFHVSRGSMSLGESQGGLPPDDVVEGEGAILEDSDRVVRAFHDPNRGAMLRVVLAPCSPFSVTSELMSETADLARGLGVTMHTHVAETIDEERFCHESFGRRPIEHMEHLGWSGSDVWYAHAVHVADDEVARMGGAGTGVAHCPTSNMRLASGIAPIGRYVDAGVPVGLGVDGSASNDGSNILREVRQALLLNRLAVSPGVGEGSMISARAVLDLATRGGAEVLGRDDIGVIAPGRAADLISVDLNRLELAGAWQDPVAALVMCDVGHIDNSWVGGNRIVAEGRLTTLDLEPLIAEHNRLSANLFE